MLGEGVESVRALTGARWSVIATVDEAGAPLDFMFSSFTREERQALLDWPDRRGALRALRRPAGHMRGLITDLLDAGRIGAGTLSVASEPHLKPRAPRRARSAGG